MYKMLIFIKQAEKGIADNLQSRFSGFAGDLFGQELRFAKIEGSAMLEEKYMYFAEIILDSKADADKKMQSGTGKEFNKFIGNAGGLVSVFFADYERN
jgi:hypothetical protein